MASFIPIAAYLVVALVLAVFYKRIRSRLIWWIISVTNISVIFFSIIFWLGIIPAGNRLIDLQNPIITTSNETIFLGILLICFFQLTNSIYRLEESVSWKHTQIIKLFSIIVLLVILRITSTIILNLFGFILISLYTIQAIPILGQKTRREDSIALILQLFLSELLIFSATISSLVGGELLVSSSMVAGNVSSLGLLGIIVKLSVVFQFQRKFGNFIAGQDYRFPNMVQIILGFLYLERIETIHNLPMVIVFWGSIVLLFLVYLTTVGSSDENHIPEILFIFLIGAISITLSDGARLLPLISLVILVGYQDLVLNLLKPLRVLLFVFWTVIVAVLLNLFFFDIFASPTGWRVAWGILVLMIGLALMVGKLLRWYKSPSPTTGTLLQQIPVFVLLSLIPSIGFLSTDAWSRLSIFTYSTWKMITILGIGLIFGMVPVFVTDQISSSIRSLLFEFKRSGTMAISKVYKVFDKFFQLIIEYLTASLRASESIYLIFLITIFILIIGLRD